MSYMKDVRAGSEGNKTLLKQYGGGSSGPRQGYATGGAVSGVNKDGPAMGEGLAAAGTPAKPSLARPGRKMGKGGAKKKDAKTNINVIVAPSAPKDAGPPPMPPMGGPPPPMPPPGAGPGGPPMPPMRAMGGKVVYRKRGGRVNRADGGEVSDTRKRADELTASSRKDAAIGGSSLGLGLAGVLGGRSRITKGIGAALGGLGASRIGGSFKDATEADRLRKEDTEDRKHGGKVCRSVGGPANPPKGFDAGAGGGKGRMEKAAKYGK